MKYIISIMIVLSFSCKKSGTSYTYSIEGEWEHIESHAVLENNQPLILGVHHHIFFENGQYSTSTPSIFPKTLIGTYKRTGETIIEFKKNAYPETYYIQIANLNDSLLTLINNEDIRDTVCYSSTGPCYAIIKDTMYFRKY